jgi:hypothetical protein
MQAEPSEDVRVSLSFNFLLGQFIYTPEDTLLTCDAGTFTQDEDNIIEAECVKKGPLLGIVTIYTFKFKGIGNASSKDPISMSSDVFSTFNQECPRYVIEMKEMMPGQE